MKHSPFKGFALLYFNTAFLEQELIKPGPAGFDIAHAIIRTEQRQIEIILYEYE